MVDSLLRLDIFAISSHPSRRRLVGAHHASVDALEAQIRRDETLLIVRELRREARLSGAAGLDVDALELAAAQIEVEAS